jgi:hypothetical protein
MRDTKALWRIILLAATIGVVAGALLFGLAFRAAGSNRPRQLTAVAAPFVRHSGAPAHGSEVVEASLDRELPPPALDAVAYDMREPLRNGRTVERKSRWLYVPEGKKIALSRGASGKLSIAVPAGTLVWKEFYLKTESGPQLIERRILAKVDVSPEKNGGLTNGGWRFWAAHFLPPSANGVTGFESQIGDTLDSAGEARWLFKPDEFLPARAKSAMTSVLFKDARGENVPYVFPGKTNCEYCHGGAMATVDNPAHQDFLSYGLHPENMTVESFRALVAKGWIDAPKDLVDALSTEPAPPADPATARVLTLWRNNCVTCHSPGLRSAGRETAFSLDPTASLTREQLLETLSAKARFMGPLGRPLVTPGKPAESEIALRLKGEEGRRRMPPTEGGVPDPDRELASLVDAWIAAR